MAHLAISLQLPSEPLKVAVPSPHTRLFQLEDGQIGLREKMGIKFKKKKYLSPVQTNCVKLYAFRQKSFYFKWEAIRTIATKLPD